MHPILLHIGAFKLPTYGLLVACGYIAAITYIFRKGRNSGFEKEDLSDLIFYSVLGGMAGAKLFYAVTYWNEFGQTFAGRISYLFKTFQYGFVFYGGLIFGASTFLFYLFRVVIFAGLLPAWFNINHRTVKPCCGERSS
ncbi:MAG: prolipoprotein diacylglyceryl transferase [Elusimicrobiota bacterium]|nr:prolipoprotein diacylglyceryl transferase [Elusimicrobiota bacterium]